MPQLFVSTGAEKWADPEHFPWTMGLNPSYRTEAQIYAKHLLQTAPNAKLAVLYQNDDFGKDYLTGLKDVLGPKYDQTVVKTVSYETTDPTVDSQVVTLQGSGADALLIAATPKFAAQAIKKVAEIGWHPAPYYLTNVSISVAAVMIPAGAENGRGIINGAYGKDQTDPQWANDPGMNEWRAFMKQWMPDADLKDANIPYGYAAAIVLKTGPAAVRRRPLARERHEAGDQPARPGDPDAAARHPDEHVPDELPHDPATAARPLDRLRVGAVRRHPRGRLTARAAPAPAPQCNGPAP